jgi:hypothetical protein
LLDHVVYGVTACTAYTENDDAGLELRLTGHGKIKGHRSVRLSFDPLLRNFLPIKRYCYP